jgi:hypothetical protein
MHITRNQEKRLLSISQKAYLEKILENAGMMLCNPVRQAYQLEVSKTVSRRHVHHGS